MQCANIESKRKLGIPWTKQKSLLGFISPRGIVEPVTIGAGGVNKIGHKYLGSRDKICDQASATCRLLLIPADVMRQIRKNYREKRGKIKTVSSYWYQPEKQQ